MFSYTAPGIYNVCLTVNDGIVNSDQVCTISVVYDPKGGFVTGGGWIDSPAGAYILDPLLTGKGTFGFVSKYQRGATVPSGNTQFQFKAGNLNFHSTSYDWLVVSGARAQYKGTGRINGAGNYGFILTAVDGQRPGGGDVDKFRMKITDTTSDLLVYDNMLDAPDSSDPTTVLGGGSIVIHTGGGSGPTTAGTSQGENGGENRSASPVLEYALSQNYPNPFGRSSSIAFSLPERSQVRLVVYDVAGRTVRTLADGEWEAGRHFATLERTSRDGSSLAAGIYFVRMNAQSLVSGRGFAQLRKLVVLR